MRNLFSQLWADDNGVVTLEYIVLLTFVGLGVIVGVNTVAGALNSELNELANAISSISQAYSADGFTTCVAEKQGSAASDSCDSTEISANPVTPCPADVDYCS